MNLEVGHKAEESVIGLYKSKVRSAQGQTVAFFAYRSQRRIVSLRQYVMIYSPHPFLCCHGQPRDCRQRQRVTLQKHGAWPAINIWARHKLGKRCSACQAVCFLPLKFVAQNALLGIEQR